MGSNVEKDIYSLDKNYVEVTFSKKRPPLDFEFNELQKIQSGLRQQFNNAALSDGPYGDGFLVEGTGNPNQLRIRSGLVFHKGHNLYNPQDITLSSLTTPSGSDRTDVVYLQWRIREVDAVEDPFIIDTVNVGLETAVRQKLDIDIYISEGGFIPDPPLGYSQYRLATINRLDGVSVIDTTQVVDLRTTSGLNYVISGGKVLPTTGFQYSVETIQGLVAGGQFNVSATLGLVAANDTRYLYISDAEVLTLAASLPTSYHVPIAKIVANGTGIATITDLRRFAPMATGGSGSNSTIFTVTAFEDISQYDLVRVSAVNTVSKADASSIGTMPVWGIAIDEGLAGDSIRVVTAGFLTNDSWSFIAGSQVYASETTGVLTTTPPATLGSVIQKLGIALTPNQLYFNPDLTYDVVGGVSSHAQNTDTGTTSDSFTLRLGQGAIASPAGVYVEKGSGDDPGIRFNNTSNLWEFSNNGTTWNSLGVLNQPFRYNTTGDGSATVFNMPVGKSFVADGVHLLVFAGTTLMTPGVDYTETSTSQVTFNSAPLTGQALSFVCFSV